MNLVLMNYVMEILWPFLIRVSRNIRTFWTSTAVLALNKTSLWDFPSAFTDKYYQVHVLIPLPLMPASPADEWCWAGAASTCSVLSHWSFSQANPCSCPTSALTKYPTSASPGWHSYTQIAEYMWASPVGILGAEGEVSRIRKVFPNNPWSLFVPEEAPHAARQGCVINTWNEVGFIL